jgi:5'(3')-deoxyribonucleotidase
VTIDKATQGSKTLEYSYNTDQLIQVLSPNNYVIKYTYNSDDTVFMKKGYLRESRAKIYHGTLYFKGKNLIKEDRILDDSARYCFEIHSGF